MLEIFKENYYVDFDAIEKYVDISEINTSEVSGGTEVKINIVRYEMVKLMMDVVMTEQDIQDEKLGIQNSNLSIPFKLAFNSLLNKKLINKY
jgi:hypothetical protein